MNYYFKNFYVTVDSHNKKWISEYGKKNLALISRAEFEELLRNNRVLKVTNQD